MGISSDGLGKALATMELKLLVASLYFNYETTMAASSSGLRNKKRGSWKLGS